MKNSLTSLLGCALPLIQAPMAGVQDQALALAVCRAGALGSLPAAMLAPDALRRALAALRDGADGPYNVNFFCHVQPAADALREAAWRARLAPYYREFGIDAGTIPAGPGRLPFSAATAEVLEEFRPAVVSFHFGLPAPDLLTRVKAWGAVVLSSATTVDEARWLEAHGADAVIVQGLEAGGHRGHFLAPGLDGQADLALLLPQVVKALSIPAIAAGGIMDADDVRAAMALGAQGVQAGSAYLQADEALTGALHRAALQSPAAHETALTNLFTGRPARGILNRFMREVGPMGEAPEFPLATVAIAPLRAQAEAQGSADFSPLWAGQRGWASRPAPAAAITRMLAAGFAQG